MKRLNVILVGCILICACLSANAQKSSGSKHLAIAEKEVRAFFDSYADDLRQHRREGIVDRYDRRGTYFMGNGRKELSTFESVKDTYMKKWKGPKSFQWKNLSFEMLSPSLAIVLGQFEWQIADDKTFNFSYTGLLVKRGGRWVIRVEDESRRQ